ncbi:hypothetical protein M885DRAFT_521797 [Pelagophyceae sp. CCMP2097]|nr:hypothetical protein M885DRAFT_521797 [Pelagophyceae sp. CCMP2097]
MPSSRFSQAKDAMPRTYRSFSIEPRHREGLRLLGWTLEAGIYESPGGDSFDSGASALRSLPEAVAQLYFPDFGAHSWAPQPPREAPTRTSRGAANDDDTYDDGTVGAAAAHLTRTSAWSSKRAAPYNAAPPDSDDYFDEEDEAGNDAHENAHGNSHDDSHDDSHGGAGDGAGDGGGDGVDDLLRSRPPRDAPQPRIPPSERASTPSRPFSIRPRHREAFSRLGWTLKGGLYVSPGLAGISFNSGNLALRSLPEADAQQFFPDFWAYLRAPQPRKTLTPRTSRGAAADDDTCVGAAAAPQTWTFSRSSKRPAPSYAEDDEVDYDEDAPPPPQARHQRRREERRRGGDDDDDATNVGLVGAAAALRTWTSSRSSKRPAPSYAEDEVDYDDEDPLPHAPSAPFHVPLSHCDAYREEFRQLGWDLTYRQCGKRWLYTSPADMTYPSATTALQSLPEAVAQQSFPAFWAHSWVPQPRGKPRAKPQPPPPSAAAAAAGQGNSPSMMQNAAPVVDEGDDNDASDHLPVDRSRRRLGVFRVKNSQNETLREAFRQLGWDLTFNGHWWFKSPAGTIYASASTALQSLPEAVARQSFPDFWAHSWAPQPRSKPRGKPRGKPQPPPPSAAAAAGQGQGGSPLMQDPAPLAPAADESYDSDDSDNVPIGQLRLYYEASTARDAAAAALAASSSSAAAAVRDDDAVNRGGVPPRRARSARAAPAPSRGATEEAEGSASSGPAYEGDYDAPDDLLTCRVTLPAQQLAQQQLVRRYAAENALLRGANADARAALDAAVDGQRALRLELETQQRSAGDAALALRSTDVKQLSLERLQALDAALAQSTSVVAAECVCCLDAPRAIVFLPCKHRCVCRGCAAKLELCPPFLCPLCREPVEQQIEPIG